MNMNVHELKGKTILFSASGGLDSCTATRWLTEHGVKVVVGTADLAQPDEKDIGAIKTRMLASGAVDFVLLDAREELAEAGLKVIQAQATYEGRYWNTTGIARYITASTMLKEMKKRGIKILSHGCTGRGNDQVRFQLASHMLAPEVEVYAPWRDEEFLKAFGGRSEMIDFCQSRNLPITASKDKPYSTDANMLGLTHEAGKLESLQTPANFITPGMGVHPDQAPDKAEVVSIKFSKGRPVEINGKKLSLLDAILLANQIGGKNGIGIGVHVVENRFVGIKSRGVYESPGMELLGSAYAYLLELVLDRRARELYDSLSRLVSRQIYQGYWYDLATQMSLSAINRTAELINGTIQVRLYKGTVRFENASEVTNSLYSEDVASMEKVGTYNHADSEGLLRVLGVHARVLSEAKQIDKDQVIMDSSARSKAANE
jgi:argininosuccinate synthase